MTAEMQCKNGHGWEAAIELDHGAAHFEDDDKMFCPDCGGPGKIQRIIRRTVTRSSRPASRSDG